MSINRAIISGNLTRDPEGRTTQGGTYVLSFGVAVNDRRKNPQTGDWEDYPNYIDCTMFGNRAQAIERYLSKGTKVCIEGKLRWSSWEKDGARRSKLEVIVEEIEFMSRANGNQQQARPAQQEPSPRQQPATASYRQARPVAEFAQEAVQIPAEQFQQGPAPQFYDEDLGW